MSNSYETTLKKSYKLLAIPKKDVVIFCPTCHSSGCTSIGNNKNQ